MIKEGVRIVNQNKNDQFSVNYWFTKNYINERHYMFWRAVATFSLAINGAVIGATIAALIFR